MRKASAADIVVNVNARQRVDVTMQVGAVTESVEVTGAAAALQTDSSEHGQVIHTQQIVELPLNGRNYSDLALLATNVHRSPIAAQPTTPREGAFNVNGMRSTYNNFLLDGMDNNAYSTSNQGFSNQVANPSPDAVAEFKVITSNFSAEYGRVGGAVVNAVMRSGTNQIHGTLYEFLRNTSLNAVGYFKPNGGVKPPLQRNQFGGTVGGPFVKNKLFFFADYEGFRKFRRSSTSAPFPTSTDRSGVLPVAVVNPLTGAVYAAGTPIPMTASRGKCSAICPTPAGRRARTTPRLIINPRDYADKYDAKIDGQIKSTDDRLPALQPAQGQPVLPADARWTVGRRRQRVRPRAGAVRLVRVHLDGDADARSWRRASASPTWSRGKQPPVPRRREHAGACTAFRACRPSPSSPAD